LANRRAVGCGLDERPPPRRKASVSGEDSGAAWAPSTPDDATQAPSGPAPVAVRARRVGMGPARKTNVPVGPTQSSSQAPIIGARRWRHRASLVPRHSDCPEPARHLGQHVCAFNPCRRTLAVYRGKAVRHTVCEADLVSVGPDNGLKPDGSGHDSAKAGRSIDVRALAFSQK
jgi:hypothetical protein